MRWSSLLLLCGLTPLLVACSSFEPRALEARSFADTIQTKTEHQVTVSVTIPAENQAEQMFGADLSSVGLQAIWLRMENASSHDYWFLVSQLDPDYFPPDEAAVLFHPRLSAKNEARITAHFRQLSMPLKIPAGTTHEGYVIAPRHEGGRYIGVSLMGRKHVLDFGFAVPLPDGDFDFESIQPETIYSSQIRPDLDLEQLRQQLRELPCCASDETGERSGDPLNLVLLGDVADMLSSMSRAGWSSTHRIQSNTVRRLLAAAISGAPYPVAPVSPLYFTGRPQDLALQRARNTILQRNHLRLWLAPFRFEGQSVWVGQVSRDISIKGTFLSPTFTTHVIDPNIDEAREHVLQSLMVAGAVRRFGFVSGIPPAPPSAPHLNLTEDPYYTDGLRLVIQLSGMSRVEPRDVEFMDWQQSLDPVKETRGKSAAGQGAPLPSTTSISTSRPFATGRDVSRSWRRVSPSRIDRHSTLAVGAARRRAGA